MNKNQLEAFHQYLQDVLEYWKRHHTLGGFSKLAKLRHVKSITKEQFFQYGLDKMDEVPRELSDKIRYDIQKLDVDRRIEKLLQSKETDNNKMEEEEEQRTQQTEPPHIDPLFQYLRGQKELPSDNFKDEYDLCNSIENTLGVTFNDIRNVRTEDILELKAARNMFASVTYLPQLWDGMTETVKHAILTMLFADEYGIQHKLDYNAQGNDSPANKYVIKILSDKGFLNDLIFARIESWKGGFFFFIVYKDAPDILVAYNGTGDVEYRTIDQFDLYTYGGETIIKADMSSRYGYGTRSSIMAFIDGISSYKSSAAAMQKGVQAAKKGKLLYDLRSFNELKQLFS